MKHNVVDDQNGRQRELKFTMENQVVILARDTFI